MVGGWGWGISPVDTPTTQTSLSVSSLASRALPACRSSISNGLRQSIFRHPTCMVVPFITSSYHSTRNNLYVAEPSCFLTKRTVLCTPTIFLGGCIDVVSNTSLVLLNMLISYARLLYKVLLSPLFFVKNLLCYIVSFILWHYKYCFSEHVVKIY